MGIQIIDLITRSTVAGAHRRQALRVPAAAAGAPVAHAAARKSGKKCQQKERQRCTNDTGACRLTITANCGSPGTCGAALLCCESCSSAGFVECVLRLVEA